MVKQLNYIKVLFFILFLLQCYPKFKNQGDTDSIQGLLYGYDFSELLGNLPEIVVSNQQTSILEGESIAIKVKLSKDSLKNREITFTSDNSAITINGSSASALTFTPDNATTEQTVTFKAEKDDNLVSEEANIRITSNWHSEIILKVKNQDKDVQGVLVTTNAEVERGTTVPLQVRLTQKPSGNVDVKISTSSDLINLNLGVLSFTPENYSVNQSLEVHAFNRLDYVSKSVDVKFEANGISTFVQTLNIKPNLEYKDISAGQGADTANSNHPDIAIDTIHSKLLMVTQSANYFKPGITRCNLDGTSCNFIDISAGQGNGSGKLPSMVIDTVNSKVLVVTGNASNVNKPGLFRCNLDGTGCAYNDISSGQGNGSGWYPDIAIDQTNSKLLVVTRNDANNGKLSLFRCNLDGTGCAHTDISSSTGQGNGSGWYPDIAIDQTNSKLLVVTKNDANNGKLSLFRCNLNGTGCIHTDISSAAGQGNSSGLTPKILLDTIHSKLYMATSDGNNSFKPALFYCNLDGTGCTYRDISTGQGSYSGHDSRLLIDQSNSKIMVITKNSSNSNRPSLFQCDLNGLDCIHSEIYIGNGNGSEISHDAIIDTLNSKVIIVSQVGTNLFKPTLFRFPLNLER